MVDTTVGQGLEGKDDVRGRGRWLARLRAAKPSKESKRNEVKGRDLWARLRGREGKGKMVGQTESR